MSDRIFPSRPFVSVGAVIADRGRVLLVKRAHPPLEGEWSLPGGVIEVGETLSAAVQREVLEETGLVVEVGPVVDVLDRIHVDAQGRVEYHYVLIDYLCTAVGGRLQARSDAADACWVGASDLASFRLTATTLTVIARAMTLARD